MKKFLSLVLALAMTMSLVTISAGAKDFTDADDITYVEAVEVMTEIGVVDGDTAGNFNATAGLTRGAAAKIICNMILGPTTASALNADAAPYVDVPADSTFAGYIAFCAKENIISGYADGTFKPAAPLTGYAFMKMLLGALGYDKSVEGYEGANWSINVAKRALNIGLDDGLVDTFNGSDYVTREEAMLYAFNALQADMVTYDTTITIGDVTIAGSKAEIMENNGKTDGNIGSKDKVMQFAEKYFTNLKDFDTEDAFMRPATEWKIKSESIGTYVDTADLTYTVAVKIGTIYSDLGLTEMVPSTSTTVYEDGQINTTWNAWNIMKGDTTNKIGGQGALTEVWYDSDNNTAIVTVVNTYVGDVDAVFAETNSRDAYVTIGARDTTNDPQGNFETEAFEVDDVVLYTYSYKTGENCIENVVLAESLTGTLTAFTTGDTATVGGTKYAYAAKVANEATSAAKNFDVVVVLDEFGNAIDIDTSNVGSEYAVVLKMNTSAGTYGADRVAQLLLTDGSVIDVTLTSDSVNPVVGSIFTYSIKNNGDYKLTATGTTGTADTSGATDIDNGTSAATLGNTSVITNGKTIFLVATLSGTDTVYTAYNGFKAVPNVTMTNSGALYTSYVLDSTSSYAKVVYVKADDTTASVTNSSKDVVYVIGKSSVTKTTDSERGDFYTYDAIVNGVITTVDSKDAYTTVKVFTNATKDKYDVYTFGGEITNTTAAVATALAANGAVNVSGTGAEKNGTVGLGGYWYAYSDDCQVFVMDPDGNLSNSTIGQIVNTSGSTADTVYYKTSDGEVVSILVVKYGAPVTNTGSTDVITLSGDFKVGTKNLLNKTSLLKAADGAYVFPAKSNIDAINNDVADPDYAGLYMFFKFNLTEAVTASTPGGVTLTIVNETTGDYYEESHEAMAVGGHYFNICVAPKTCVAPAGLYSNGSGYTIDTSFSYDEDWTKGSYTYEVVVNGTALISGNFEIA